MCAPLIPSWSFPSTVLKEMNTLPWLPRIFIGNWAAACYSCSWFYPAADPISGDWIRVVADYILRPTRSPAASYNLRLSRVPAVDSSYDWFELWQRDTKYVWFHPTTDSSSSGWKRVAADSILRLTRVPAARYNLQLSWFILRLTTSCGWFYSAADSSSGDWARNVADLYFNISSRFKDLLCKIHLLFFSFFFCYLPLNSVSTDSGPGYCFKNLKAAWRSLGKLEKASRL